MSRADVEMAGNDETMPPMLVDWDLAGDDTNKEGKPKNQVQTSAKGRNKGRNGKVTCRNGLVLLGADRRLRNGCRW